MITKTFFYKYVYRGESIEYKRFLEFKGKIMRNLPILLLLISLFCPVLAFSQLYDGQKLAPATLEALVSRVMPGTVVLLGENHGLAAHRDQHLQILQELRKKGLKISVGLEFINYTDQPAVDLYRNQKLSEEEFLKTIAWAGFGFEFYRPQLNFPDPQTEFSLGLNIPRTITSHISKNGIGSLTPEELSLMPPDFALGRDSYKERFMAAAGAHCKNPDNCFAAQCAWDDTMAQTATQFLNAHPDQVLVIVVGEFHVQFGGGLGFRIQSRRPQTNIVSLSQIWAEDMTDNEIAAALQPSLTEGPRADFIWVSRP